MKIFFIQLIISIHFSFQQNNINNITKDGIISLEDIKKGINELNFENAISNITKLFQNQLFNLTEKLNDLINKALENQELILNDSESERLLIKDMLSEINTLKKRYRKNVVFTYIIGIIILCTFFIFYYTDHLNRRKRKKYAGYKNPAQTEYESNQIDIE